ncbi:MAG: SPOR domain-containing protein [Candidatus Omnitrophota bacterium]
MFHVKNHEKIILVITGMIISSIISFSLGVEKGKSLVAVKGTPRMDMAMTKQPVAEVKKIVTSLPVEIKKEAVAEKPPALPEKEGYAIQLACYKSDSYANKEAAVLKETGLTPIIQKKGEYTVLSVGDFPNRESATLVLPKLKKRYQGCYIRRL